MDAESKTLVRGKESPDNLKTLDLETYFSTKMNLTIKHEMEDIVTIVPFLNSQRSVVETLIDRYFHSTEFRQYRRLKELTERRAKQSKKNDLHQISFTPI